MQFAVDESTGEAVVTYLRAVGHDVLAVAETMPRAPDPDVLAQAASERRDLITNDKDFGELAVRGGQAHARVVLLRLEDNRPANRVRVVRAVLEHWAPRLAGAFVVASERAVRFHLQPETH